MSNEMTTEQEQFLIDNDITKEQWRTLNSSLFPGANPKSLLLYMSYCKARKLDPMKKPAHIVPMNVKDAQSDKYVWRDVIMPGIYEYRTTAARTGLYAGQDEVVFGPDIEHEGGPYGKVITTVPSYAKVTVYRIVDGVRCAFTGVAYFTETCATKKDGSLNAMWTKRPRGQLAKCAEADALRKAFPDELGGEMTVEELEGKLIEGTSFFGTTPYSDEQYQAFLDLIDGQKPLAYFVFIKSLSIEQNMAIFSDYKSSIKTGKKGKEMNRIDGVYKQGESIAKLVNETIESGTDDEMLEAYQELSESERAYIIDQLSPAGIARIEQIQKAA